MRAALFKLPDDYREPLLLQVLMGYSTAEIARELNLSAAAVLTRLFRARQQLRALCGEDTGAWTRRMMDCATIDHRSWPIRTLRIRGSPSIAGAAATAVFSEQLLRFESSLGRALRVALRRWECCRLQRAAFTGCDRASAGWLAMAASVLMAAWWRESCGWPAPDRASRPMSLTHMTGEPDAWPPQASGARRRACGRAARFAPALERNRRGPGELRRQLHVSRSSRSASGGADGSGPVTVMVLVHERVRRSRCNSTSRVIAEPSCRCAGHGSLAVLMRGSDHGEDESREHRNESTVRLSGAGFADRASDRRDPRFAKSRSLSKSTRRRALAASVG